MTNLFKKSNLKFSLLAVLGVLACNLLFSFSPLSLIYANETTEPEEASPSATDSLKNRIEKVVEEKKVEVNLQTSTQVNNKKRGFISQIERVSEEAITLKNEKGTQVVPVNQSVSLLKNDQETSLEDLAVGNWVTVMGVQNDDDDDFEALKIVVSEDKLSPQPQVVAIGAITKLAGNELTIQPRKNDSEVVFELSSDTRLQDIEGQNITRADLFEDMQCLIAGFKDIEEGEDADSAANQVLLVYSLAPVRN